MTFRTMGATFVIALLCSTAALAADPYSIKTAKVEIPKEVKKPIRELLNEEAVQFMDGKGNVIADIWFRKALPVTASADSVKKGLKPQQLPKTTLLGTIRLHKKLGDYRKQTPKAGVYTMRLAFQPSDGDHMGTAPINSFVLICPIDGDSGRDSMDMEKLFEESGKSAGTGHACIYLVLPAGKSDTADKPTLKKKLGDHWVVYAKCDVTVKGKKMGTVTIGLTMIGFSEVA